MGYLKHQVTQIDFEDDKLIADLVTVFEINPNQKMNIAEIIGKLVGTYDYVAIDTAISKLVSRGLISEYYISDIHFFEYSVSIAINSNELRDEIINELKSKGYRITDSRKKLIELFTSMPNKHFDFDELVKLSGKKVNIATMYNNLATLSDEKIINDFYVEDTRMFELNNISHAHFVCETCKDVFNVETNASINLDEEVANQYGFDVHSRKLEFTGVCATCKLDSINQQSENVTIVNEHNYPSINEIEILKYFNYLQRKTNNNTKGITLVFLPSEEIHRLNKEFRDIDRPTDVLTFVEDSDDYLGDVLICYDYIKKQADEYGHSFKRELYFLITHGYLHLLGYDHLSEEEEKEMFALQTDLLNKYGVSRDE